MKTKSNLPIVQVKHEFPDSGTREFEFPKFEAKINNREDFWLTFYRGKAFFTLPEEILKIKAYFLDLNEQDQLGLRASLMALFLVYLCSGKDAIVNIVGFLFICYEFCEENPIIIIEEENDCKWIKYENNNEKKELATFAKEFLFELRSLFGKSQGRIANIRCNNSYYIVENQETNNISTFKFSTTKPPIKKFPYEESRFAKIINFLSKI